MTAPRSRSTGRGRSLGWTGGTHGSYGPCAIPLQARAGPARSRPARSRPARGRQPSRGTTDHFPQGLRGRLPAIITVRQSATQAAITNQPAFSRSTTQPAPRR
jgi:hypothetical protein